ncbi:MAG: M48 family metalloprotease, partial [Planctomycetes bacterium]|nr:M48 family metalloprotease [Planctomycetota bacterium]
EVRIWNASREAAQEIVASDKLYPDRELQQYCQSVLERLLSNNLAPYAPLAPRVQVVDCPEVNAFALSHGDVFIHTAMIGRLRNEAQLAMMLGHEITHATHRHMYQEREDAYARRGATSYIAVISAMGGGNIQTLATRLSEFITQAAITGYSRDKERESDRVGLILTAQAGYDPKEGACAFERFLAATDKADKGWNFLYATHPKMKERVDSLRELVPEMPPELLATAKETCTDRYVTHAAPLIYREVEVHIAAGKFALAEETITFMRQSRPDDIQPLYLRGDLLRAKGDQKATEEAKAAYQAALEKSPTCAPAHRGLGLLCRKSGDTAGAIEHFRKYVELAPSAPDAKYIGEYVKSVENKK